MPSSARCALQATLARCCICPQYASAVWGCPNAAAVLASGSTLALLLPDDVCRLKSSSSREAIRPELSVTCLRALSSCALRAASSALTLAWGHARISSAHGLTPAGTCNHIRACSSCMCARCMWGQRACQANGSARAQMLDGESQDVVQGSVLGLVQLGRSHSSLHLLQQLQRQSLRGPALSLSPSDLRACSLCQSQLQRAGSQNGGRSTQAHPVPHSSSRVQPWQGQTWLRASSACCAAA